MKCKDARAAISARFDGEDIGFDSTAFEAHLAECRDCRAEAEALGHAGELLRAAVVIEPSASFDERVLGGLGRKNWLDRIFDWFDVPIRRLAVTLAFSALVISGAFLTSPYQIPRPDATTAILEMQARQMGIDLSEIRPMQPVPMRRSDGGTSKWA